MLVVVRTGRVPALPLTLTNPDVLFPRVRNVQIVAALDAGELLRITTSPAVGTASMLAMVSRCLPPMAHREFDMVPVGAVSTVTVGVAPPDPALPLILNIFWLELVASLRNIASCDALPAVALTLVRSVRAGRVTVLPETDAPLAPEIVALLLSVVPEFVAAPPVSI